MDRLGSVEPRIIDGYKRDTRGRLVTAMLPGIACAIVGAMLLLAGTRELLARDRAAAFRGRATSQIVATQPPPEAEPTEPLFLYLGTLFCVASPVVMAFSLRRLLDDEDFLLLRTDGLVHQSGGRALLFPWDEVETIRFDAREDALVVVMADETEFRITDRYLGATPGELAARVADFRRKAMWNLLPSQKRRQA